MKDITKSGSANTFSIGDVADATGISVFTLRMWERRYGAPFASKLESGHRRYDREEIQRLKLVKTALDSGKKPSLVVSLAEHDLRQLLANHNPGTADMNGDAVIEAWLQQICSWDDKALVKHFQLEWNALGPIGFITERLVPLLQRMGAAWHSGELTIADEHFASQLLERFISDKWHLANQNLTSSSLILTSLEGEHHELGLHMCATVLSTCGCKVIFLGNSTPVRDIIQFAASRPALGLCISVSEYYDQKLAAQSLKMLRQQLPADRMLIVGGNGAPKNLEGVVRFDNFKSFYNWIRTGNLLLNQVSE